MKKIILLTALFLVSATPIFTVKADNDRAIRFEQLPEISKKFIHTYFKGNDISYAKSEQDFLSKSYEIYFVNGSKVEFNRRGQWEEVDCRREEIPAGIVPSEIVKYVKQNYPGVKIVKISRNRRDYEVKLNNHIEIKFDTRFNMIGYDD